MENLKVNDTKFYVGTGAEISPIYKTMLKHGFVCPNDEPARFNKGRLYSLWTGDYDEDGWNPDIVCIGLAKNYLASVILDILPVKEDRERLGKNINAAVADHVSELRMIRKLQKARKWLRNRHDESHTSCDNCNACEEKDFCIGRR